jgi:hypothetical protein
MIPNYKEIFDAWVTAINPTEKEKELANKRLDVCKGCEFRKETIKGYKWSTICSACGCPLSKKVFSNAFNPCPKGIWEEVDSQYKDKLSKKNKNTII